MSLTEKLKEHPVRNLVILFLLVYHVFLLYSLSTQPVMLMDSREYINSGNNFLRRGNFYAGNPGEAEDFRLYSKRTPFYPLLLAFFKATGLHLNLIYILQVFAGLSGILLAFMILGKLSPDAQIPYYLAGLLILLTPSQFIYSQFIMADIWLQFFLMLYLYTVFLYLEHKQSWILTFPVVFSTMAMLTKPVFLPAAMITGVAVIWIVFRNKHPRAWLLLVFLPLFTWLGISEKNRKETGVFHYSSIGNINLLHYNTNLFLEQSESTKPEQRLLDTLMNVPRSRGEFMDHYSDVSSVCGSLLRKHWPGYILYHLKGSLYFFLDPGRFDLYNFFRVEKGNSHGFLHKGLSLSKFKSIFSDYRSIGWVLLLTLLINILKLIGFVGWAIQRRKDIRVLAGVALVLYLALLTGPLGASRFCLPVTLILSVYAALFYIGLIKRFKARPGSRSGHQSKSE